MRSSTRCSTGMVCTQDPLAAQLCVYVLDTGWFSHAGFESWENVLPLRAIYLDFLPATLEFDWHLSYHLLLLPLLRARFTKLLPMNVAGLGDLERDHAAGRRTDSAGWSYPAFLRLSPLPPVAGGSALRPPSIPNAIYSGSPWYCWSMPYHQVNLDITTCMMGHTHTQGWVPHSPTAAPATVFASLWPLGGSGSTPRSAAWTVVNRDAKTPHSGAAINVTVSAPAGKICPNLYPSSAV